jgi:hypothetical protein
MNKVGLLATLPARPDKEAEVEQFLRSAGPLVEAETGTTTWFAFRGRASNLRHIRYVQGRGWQERSCQW